MELFGEIEGKPDREPHRADVVGRAEELRTQIRAGRREKNGGREIHVLKQRRGANADMGDSEDGWAGEISPPEFDPAYIITELLRGYDGRK